MRWHSSVSWLWMGSDQLLHVVLDYRCVCPVSYPCGAGLEVCVSRVLSMWCWTTGVYFPCPIHVVLDYRCLCPIAYPCVAGITGVCIPCPIHVVLALNLGLHAC